jgi:hypothetical protein
MDSKVLFHSNIGWGSGHETGMTSERGFTATDNPNVNPKSKFFTNTNPTSTQFTHTALPGMRFKRYRAIPGRQRTMGRFEKSKSTPVRLSNPLGLGNFAEQNLNLIKAKSTNSHLRMQKFEGMPIGDFAVQNLDGINQAHGHLKQTPTSTLRWSYRRATSSGTESSMEPVGLGDFASTNIDELRHAAKEHDAGYKSTRRDSKKVEHKIERGVETTLDKAKSEIRATVYEISAGVKKMMGRDDSREVAKAAQIREEHRQTHALTRTKSGRDVLPEQSTVDARYDGPLKFDPNERIIGDKQEVESHH